MIDENFSPDNYISDRIMAPARDGVEVPVSIVYHKNTPMDGSAPILVYAYGSYGSTMDPYFSIARLSLLDRGFVFALAHVRGGQEMGRQWYENGKLLNKKNTFTDFIDVSEHLVEQKYAAADKVFAMGGSAGGLLMGAIVNMRPDMWAGVVAAVPFVDVVTTMLDETIPLTTFEWDEWGDPREKEYYDYMKSYSPYDNVEAKDYPNMLVTTGYWDSQVQYWEPAKWVALMRELKTDNNALLMTCDMEAGHGGGVCRAGPSRQALVRVRAYVSAEFDQRASAAARMAKRASAPCVRARPHRLPAAHQTRHSCGHGGRRVFRAPLRRSPSHRAT